MVRKNRILLAHLKNPVLLKYCREHGDYTLLHIYDMAALQKKVVEAVLKSGEDDEKLPYEVELIGRTYYSSKYRTDEAKGLCEDLDKSSVRYVNIERNRVFKMRAGKVHEGAILETGIGKLYSSLCSKLEFAGVFSLSNGVLILMGNHLIWNFMSTMILGKSMTVTIVKGVSVHAWWMRTGLRSIMIR